MLPKVLSKIMQQVCHMESKILETFRATGSFLEREKLREFYTRFLREF
jgi:hypothetical protein